MKPGQWLVEVTVMTMLTTLQLVKRFSRQWLSLTITLLLWMTQLHTSLRQIWAHLDINSIRNSLMQWFQLALPISSHIYSSYNPRILSYANTTNTSSPKISIEFDFFFYLCSYIPYSLITHSPIVQKFGMG